MSKFRRRDFLKAGAIGVLGGSLAVEACPKFVQGVLEEVKDTGFLQGVFSFRKPTVPFSELVTFWYRLRFGQGQEVCDLTGFDVELLEEPVPVKGQVPVKTYRIVESLLERIFKECLWVMPDDLVCTRIAWSGCDEIPPPDYKRVWRGMRVKGEGRGRYQINSTDTRSPCAVHEVNYAQSKPARDHRLIDSRRRT